MGVIEEIFAGLAKILMESGQLGVVLKAIGVIELLEWLSTHPWVAVTAVTIVIVSIISASRARSR
jgi:hypothetical protein